MIALGGIILVTGQAIYKGVAATEGQAKLGGLVLIAMGVMTIYNRLKAERKQKK